MKGGTGGIVQVTERYPLSGETREFRRRDLRRGTPIRLVLGGRGSRHLVVSLRVRLPGMAAWWPWPHAASKSCGCSGLPVLQEQSSGTCQVAARDSRTETLREQVACGMWAKHGHCGCSIMRVEPTAPYPTLHCDTKLSPVVQGSTWAGRGRGPTAR